MEIPLEKRGKRRLKSETPAEAKVVLDLHPADVEINFQRGPLAQRVINGCAPHRHNSAITLLEVCPKLCLKGYWRTLVDYLSNMAILRHEKGAKMSDSDLRLQYSLRILSVHRDYSPTALLTRMRGPSSKDEFSTDF